MSYSGVWKNAKDYANHARIRKAVLLKSFREQDKGLFFQAVINAIRGAAEDNHYGDGFVEWHMVEAQMEDWLESIKEKK